MSWLLGVVIVGVLSGILFSVCRRYPATTLFFVIAIVGSVCVAITLTSFPPKTAWFKSIPLIVFLGSLAIYLAGIEFLPAKGRLFAAVFLSGCAMCGTYYLCAMERPDLIP